MLALPHTAGCLVCGRENPYGLHLNLSVDPATGIVGTEFNPTAHHIGFTGIAHGGVLALVFDEAMVWTATWQGRRFCYCGEMTVRYRKPALIGELLIVKARVLTARSRLITTSASMQTMNGEVIAESTAKYVPMSAEMNRAISDTFIVDASTADAVAHLQSTSSA